jgi:membrane-bound lytic murein transglycosylase A
MTMADVLTPVAFAQLKGWEQADLSLSLAAFQRSAREMLEQASGFRRHAQFSGTQDDWRAVCEKALLASDARPFFETEFQPFGVRDNARPQGLFTGYYEPLVEGCLTPDPRYPVPVYEKPKDLVAFTAEEQATTGLSYGRRIAGKPQAYDIRKDIETGVLAGKVPVICWLSDWVDAFFMHVQGQGRVALQDGKYLRLSYAGKTGHAYTGIGHVLVERGVATKDMMSMQVLRDWMKENPAEARALMWQNKSYIFFQKADVTDPALGGIGAAKVNLTPLHSLAVDRAFWMFGTPLWIDTSLPPEARHGAAAFQQLMIAQDTGSAIKGLVRGDVFWGADHEAAHLAGHMKSAGRMTALLPHAVARALGYST